MKIEQVPASAITEAVEPPSDIYGRGDRALILHTQRLSTEDGPGIRTTVFFKGCPLQCTWCHNPESISTKPQVQWMEIRCIGCNTCVKICPRKSLTRTRQGILRDRKSCQSCGRCAEECPANAMELLGRQVSLQGLTEELLKDRVYYDKSGGGITLSGGEPLIQPDFCTGVLRAMKEKGVSTAVDTCGLCSKAALEKVLPYTDLMLYDLKEIDPEKHKELTGRYNGRILENVLFIRDYVLSGGNALSLWIRTPLIPGSTTFRDNIERIGKFIYINLNDVIQRWELCAFNNLCRDKYRRLGLDWKHAEEALMPKKDLMEFERIAKNTGVNPDIVFVTGASRIEN
jgi:pyruvate formate lyase activating enzyme